MDGAVPGTLLAFDDTDSPDGMCTTYLAALLVEEFSDLDLIGLPRLVRLNPNIPWKTRGNAAICISLGHGRGKRRVCGNINGRAVSYYPEGSGAEPAELLARAARVVGRVSELSCPKTNPGVVVSGRRPPQSLYWGAVRTVLKIGPVEGQLRDAGALIKKFKNGRGIIGAGAAMAWRPHDRTWEVIAYRHPEAWGTPRAIDPSSVVRMDRRTKFTFNNYDYGNSHVAIAPGSPCPILFGIRGDEPNELLKARTMIRGEKADKWLMFLTNQATEDHVVRSKVAALRPRMSAKINVRVSRPPLTIVGGHVIVRVTDGDGIDAAFYEPSREFRDAARKLIPGDELLLYGSVRPAPRSFNVEKMRVISLAEDVRKTQNPLCASCGKRMGSMGSHQGFRCKICKRKEPESSATYESFPRQITPGWYEPPVSSRRHLHKPLRRMSRVNIDNL
jgi:tRNA(Ile2)-agmatinylcytidine synthase